jgi:polyisoprenoid-binding protein YceI
MIRAIPDSIRPLTPVLLSFTMLATLVPAAHTDALANAAGTYRIDKNSTIRFKVGQTGGGGIDGSFASYGGTFRIDGSNLSKSSVTITLYPKSVRANEPRMEEFLRSDAVFDVAVHPEISFRSTSVTRTGDNTARIDGVLTARGKARKAEFAATLQKQSGSGIAFHVTGSIYRSPYGMGVGTPIYSNVVQFDMMLHGTRK